MTEGAGLRRAHGLAWLAARLEVPGLPRVPRALALLALGEPRLVPPFLRWKAASGGLGLVVARLMATSNPETSAVLHAIGLEQGSALREQLFYGRDPLECARAVALANRIFGIAARVEEVATAGETGCLQASQVPAALEEVRVVTPGCPWSRQPWWGPQPCGAFSRYEVGLVAGLNPDVRLRYISKRTRGDQCCIGVYTWREEGGS